MDMRNLNLRANKGDTKAQTELGKLYYEGKSVPRYYEKAANIYFLEAAKQDDAEAQFYYGKMLYEGKGVAKNYAQAVHWWRKAAEQGDAAAQYGLGLMYVDGDGVPKNYIAAYQWISLAAAQGHEKAGESLDELEKEMTPNQIAKAQKQTAEWLEAHPNAAE